MVDKIIDRRDFLTHSLGVAAGVAIGASGVEAIAGGTTQLDIAKATKSDFDKRIGETFQIHTSSRLVTLTLVETKDLTIKGKHAPPAHAAISKSRKPFRITFRGLVYGELSDKTYTIEHRVLGKFDLFLVPVGPQIQALRYDSVFS